VQDIDYYDDGNRSVAVDAHPKVCPVCHHKIRPIQTSAVRRAEDILQVCFRCPDEDCDVLFIAVYEAKPYASAGAPEYKLVGCLPKSPAPANHSEEIQAVSASFVEIWDQASAAEFHGLKEVAGVGYRKSLEYLIKDYLIGAGVARDEVVGKLLGKCIKDHVQEPRIKRCAERAAWLGNDETHYSRKWEEFGLSDLKELIQMSVAWIELEKRTEHFEQQMPHGK
jgi:hypothetical protein